MDTIASIATAIGVGGINIIRVSGEEAISSVNEIFLGKDLKKVSSHTLNYGHIIKDNLKIDEVLVSVMNGPHSYTGEDVVEINCHGGILITKKILEIVLEKNVRLANRGEFTQRAFLNGKKDMEEVQNIMDLINAQNNSALNLAISKLNQKSGQLVEELRQELLKIVTNIEVNIDYPEYEDLKQVKNEDIKKEIDNYINLINTIIRDTQNGEIIKNGIQTAIVGEPNVGKSSILNYLSKENKAIVSDIKGTTRDVIETEIKLDDLTLNLIDTAGIRDTQDEVERLGVEKSLEQIKKAQLILFVLDGTRKMTKEEEELLVSFKELNKKYIILVNKNDQQRNLDLTAKESNVVYVSALEKYGEKEIANTISKILDIKDFDAMNAKVLGDFEQLNDLKQVKNIILKVQEDLHMDAFLDLILIDLKEALFILGDILGLEVKEDYLNEIFSRFCLGK